MGFPNILRWTELGLEGVQCRSRALNWHQESLSCLFLSVDNFGRTPKPELSLVSLWGWMCVMGMAWAGTVTEQRKSSRTGLWVHRKWMVLWILRPSGPLLLGPILRCASISSLAASLAGEWVSRLGTGEAGSRECPGLWQTGSRVPCLRGAGCPSSS